MNALAPAVIPGHTSAVKIAISMPDETFRRAVQAAADRGVSRSELISRAVRRYLDEAADQSLSHDIDAALDLIGPDDSSAAATAAGRRRLDGDW